MIKQAVRTKTTAFDSSCIMRISKFTSVYMCVCLCVCLFRGFRYIDLFLHAKEQKPPFVNIIWCNHKTIPHAILSHQSTHEQYSIAQNYVRTTLHGAICRGQLLCCPLPPPVIYKPNLACEISQ